MALQFSETYRNVLLNALASTLDGSEVIKIWSGSVPANCAAADGGTLLVAFNLAISGDWGNPAAGQIALAGVPINATVSTSGTAGYFRHYDGFGNCHMQGTVALVGHGGDLSVTNTSLIAGQQVSLSFYDLTAPGA